MTMSSLCSIAVGEWSWLSGSWHAWRSQKRPVLAKLPLFVIVPVVPPSPATPESALSNLLMISSWRMPWS